MLETYMQFQRNPNAPMPKAFPVQIDNASETAQAYYGGNHPFDVFKIYVFFTTLVFQRDDILIDTKNIDPITGKNATYRVVGYPAPFPDGHVELYVNKYATRNNGT